MGFKLPPHDLYWSVAHQWSYLPGRLRASEAKGSRQTWPVGSLCQYLLFPPESSTLHRITLRPLTQASFQFPPVLTSGCRIGGTPHRIQLPESLCSSALCLESLGGISRQQLCEDSYPASCIGASCEHADISVKVRRCRNGPAVNTEPRCRTR